MYLFLFSSNTYLTFSLDFCHFKSTIHVKHPEFCRDEIANNLPCFLTIVSQQGFCFCGDTRSMKQVKIKQCRYYGCPEPVIQGEFCWTHRRYEQAIPQQYCKRSLPRFPSEHTILEKLIDTIEKINSEKDDSKDYNTRYFM